MRLIFCRTVAPGPRAKSRAGNARRAAMLMYLQ